MSLFPWFTRKKTRPVRRRPSLIVEILEDRTVPTAIVVTTAADTVSHTGLSLRDAIVQANTDAAAGTSDTITFDPSLAGKTITLAQGQLELKGHGGGTITIDGGGQITLSGNQASRIFLIDASVTAMLDGLTLVKGSGGGGGGAIDNAGMLSISDSTLSGNVEAKASVDYGGGAISNGAAATLTVNDCAFSGNSANFAGGGAIANLGTAMVTDSSFNGNSGGTIAADHEGGAVENVGAMTVTGSSFTGNTASRGGGLMNGGTAMTVSGCTFTGNIAEDGGGFLSGGEDEGAAAATVSDSVFTDNGADSGGAILLLDSSTLTGLTLTGNSASQLGGAIRTAGGAPTLSNSTLAGNTAPAGGGIMNNGALTLTACTITGNSAQFGGGIDSPEGLTANNDTITSNTASFDGGGIYCSISPTTVVLNDSVVSGNNSPDGAGGIDCFGTLTVIGSTFSGNSGYYGAINSDGALTVSDSTISGNTGITTGGISTGFDNSATVTNSTLYGNIGSSAGGISSSFQLTVSDSTIVDNTATGVASANPGGGIHSSDFLTVINTIVAHNNGLSPDIAGTASDSSSNDLIGIGTGLSGLTNGTDGNQVGTSATPLDPLLGPLAGAPTQTLAPQPGSPALNVAGPLTTLFADIGVGDTTFYVNDGAAIASSPGTYLIQVDSEQMLVTNVDFSGFPQLLTVQRGVNGTMAALHDADANVFDPADQVGQPRGASPDIGAFQLQTNTTTHALTLTPGQTETGQLSGVKGIDAWSFTASAGAQVQFQLQSASGVLFDLTGPGGYTAFVNATGSSGLIDLPATGTYTLNVHAAGAAGTLAYSFDLAPTPVAALVLNGSFPGTITASGQAQLLTVTVTSPTVLTLALTDPNAADVNDVYVSFNAAPTPDSHQFEGTGGGADQNVSFAAEPGTYDVLVYNSAATAGSYTLQATTSAFLATSVSPGQVVANQAALVLVQGFFPLAQEAGSYTAQFVSAGGAVLPATPLTLAVTDDGSGAQTDLAATLPANTLPAGTYAIRLTDSQGNKQTLPGALTVSASGGGVLATSFLLPTSFADDQASTIYLQYENVGNAPMPAPLLGVTMSQNGVQAGFLTLNPALAGKPFTSATTPAGFSSTVQFLGSGAVAGILEPGEAVIVPIYYGGWLLSKWHLAGPTTMSVSVAVQSSTSTQALNWKTLAAGLQPSYINAAAWSALLPNLMAQLGTTWGQYVQALDSDAVYLAGVGNPTNNIDQLLYFEIEKANDAFTDQTPVTVTADSLPTPGVSLSFVQAFNESISGRYTSGVLGYGWTTNWNISAGTDAAGDAIINDNGTTFVFARAANGSYVPEAGTTGTLTLAGGAYHYVASGGSVYQFNHNGTLAYLQDANGNRISARDNSAGKLVELLAANGEYLLFGYNAQGRLATLLDSTGAIVTYKYDPTGQFLTSITNTTGVTTFSYVAGKSAAQNNALATITNPDGIEVFFGYDTHGRLTDQHGTGGAEDQTVSYLSPGGYVTADALGHQITTYFNFAGVAAESIDPLGNITRSLYDSNLNRTEIINPNGQTYTFTYDTTGQVASATDPLGNTVHYTYDANSNLTSYTDGNDNTTTYAYNAHNDLLSITYADATGQQFTYNPLGEAQQILTADGASISKTYNAEGLVTGETFADGTSFAFVYDGRGNLLTAADASGTITFKYLDSAHPNLYTEVDYPGSLSLTFTYNAAGQRIRSVDQTGYTINYTYDALGRLATLTDGSNKLIVQYTYDTATGVLLQKDLGNLTRTVYTYDKDGNVLSITNDAPDHTTVNSFDDYTYDALGNVLSDTSQDGVWTYTYDADNELTQAVFTPNGTDPDGLTAQNLQYAYDAAGNRVSATVNGVTTTYVVNAVNEYTSSVTGGVTTLYTYDDAGNLIAQSTGASTTNFTFNELSQLTAVSGPGTSASYSYDPLGNLVAQTVNGATTSYQIDPSGSANRVAAFDGSGSLLEHFTYGLGLTSTVDPLGNAAYYDFNNVDSTVGLTGASGAYVDRYTYMPFGQTTTVTATVANPFTFSGGAGALDDGSGTLLMGARTYDPQTGQFLSIDPLGLDGGDTNTRRYVGNGPTAAIDPMGMWSIFLGFSGGLGISGTGGLTINSTGQVFLTNGVGGTSGGVTVASINPADATAGDSVDYSGTLGAGPAGVTAHNTIGDTPNGPAYSPGGSLDFGFKVPGVSVNHYTNSPVFNWHDLFNRPPGQQPPSNPPPGGNNTPTPTPPLFMPPPVPPSTTPTPPSTTPVSSPDTSPQVFWNNPSDITYGTPLSNTQLNATSNVGGSYKYDPPAGTVLDAGMHTLNVTFQPDIPDYPPIKMSVTINVQQAQVTINWNPPADISYGDALTGAQLNATATAVVNGATVTVAGTFTYTPPAGTVLDAGLQFLSVDFTPDDAVNYTTTSDFNVINVQQAQSVIDWDDPGAIVYGTPLSGDQLNATAYAVVAGAIVDVPGTFDYTPDFGEVLDAGDGQPLFVNFTPDDSVNYTTEFDVVFIDVLQAQTTIVWPQPGNITYGTPLSGAQLNAEAQADLDGGTFDIPGEFDYTPAEGTVLAAGENPLSVQFTPDDDVNFTDADGTNSITIDKATPSVSVTDMGGPYDGQAYPAMAEVAGVDNVYGPMLELSRPAVQYYVGTTPTNQYLLTAPPVEPGTYTALATFPGSPDYTGASNATVFNITAAAPTFTSANTTTFTVGQNGIFTINAPSAPVAALSHTGALPSGVGFTDNGNGTATLSGIPDPAIGNYTFDITANNGGATATQVFTLVIADPPTFSSANQGFFNAGKPGAFTVSATSSVPAPVSFSLSGTIPTGITLHTAGSGSATLSGTVAAPGAYTFDIIASNGPHSTTTQFFMLNVDLAPTITNGPPTPFTAGLPGNFAITTKSYPTPTITESGILPTNVSFTDNGNGTASVSGTPTAGSTTPFAFSITAKSGANSVTQNYTLIVNQPPTFTSTATTTFTAGAPGSYPITTTGSVPANVKFSTSGTLPKGVTLSVGSSGSATLSGTPKAGTGGAYTFQIIASNGVTAPVAQMFTLDVNQAPLITSPAAATFAVGIAGSFTVKTSGLLPMTLTKSGTLPAGVTFVDNGNGTGTLAGTPLLGAARATPFSFTITAHNADMPDFMQTFLLTVDQPPVIASPNSAAFTIGTAGTFTVTTGPAIPATVALKETGPLPAGVKFLDNKNGTATLSGTPKPGSSGTYFINLAASNGTASTATQIFKLTVQQAPAITSAASTTFAQGLPGTFAITTTGFPTATLTESGTLPANVTFVDNGNGTASLKGTPQTGAAQAAPYSLTITAHNGAAADVKQTFLLTVDQLPVFTSAAADTFTVGQAQSFMVQTAPGLPSTAALTINAKPPAGLTFTDNHNGTATLAGTAKPGTGGTYSLTITASNNAFIKSTQTFTLTVNEAPTLTSAASTTFTIGQTGKFTVTTHGFPVSMLAKTGTLPAGVTFTDNGNGTATLTGIPQAGPGAYPITITANNTIGNMASQMFKVTVAPAVSPAPVITSGKSATFAVGQPGAFTVTTKGFPAPALATTSTLPAGVTFVDNGNGTASLSGIPQAGAGGTYSLTITAKNGVLPNATQTFALTVDEPTAFTSPNNFAFTVNQSNTFTVQTAGFPLAAITFSGTLPNGVTLVDQKNGTAILSGMPTASGDFQFTILASVGGIVEALQSFDLTVN